MKVILYMAVTANGLIAREDDSADFVSKTSWKSYLKKVRESDYAVIGKRTYEIMPVEEFIKETKYLVFTHVLSLEKKVKNVEFTNKPLKDVLHELKNKGVKKAAIFGGGKLNASFMAQNLVDEIFLDVMSIVLGKGIPLFNGENFEAKLKLLGVKKLSANEMQLHFKVKK